MASRWRPTDAELAIWYEFVRDVKKNDRSKIVFKEPNLQKPVIKVRENNKSPIENIQSLTDLKLGDYSNVDRRTTQCMDEGKYPIDVEVDLHGFTLANAFNILHSTILKSWQLDCRMILVITGKGLRNNTDTIKSALLNWLNMQELRKYVLRVSSAHRKHGGSGAFYILLKRARPS